MNKIVVSLFLVAQSLILVGQVSYIQVLGIAQDGGFPHIGCQNECQLAFKDPSLKRFVVSLALVDEKSGKWWMFEATPDFDDQLQYFRELTNGEFDYLPEGIFITHAHIGHYTGLMSLGREALGAKGVKVYILPKMKAFLERNGPWSQLVTLGNIQLVELSNGGITQLTDEIGVESFTVPHRDEFSETAGFKIRTSSSSYLFIPDIDKWSKWERDVVKEVKLVDFAFLDGSFMDDGELPNRSMSEVPHPFVPETMELFEREPNKVKEKLHFIHFNHTNPILFDPMKRQEVKERGFSIAEQGKVYD